MINKQKTILFISWFFYPKTGGVESLLLNQALYFARRGYTIIVLTSSIPGLKELEKYEGITILRKKFMDSKERYPVDLLTKEFRKIIEQYNPAIAHFHNGSYPSGTTDRSIGVEKVLELFRILKEHQIYVIEHAHNAQLVIEHAHNAQLSDTEITAPLRQLPWDQLICVSNFVRGEWKRLGTRAKRIQTIYNGIDLDRFKNVKSAKIFSRLKKGGDKIIFFPARVVRLSTGEISKQKNFMLVVEACSKLVKTGVKNFKLVATFNASSASRQARKTKQKLMKKFEKGGISEKIEFLPSIKPRDMPAFYAGVDIICVPSIKETFGLIYLEAMASRKVAIASNSGGPKEYIKNGKNGFLVDAEDAEGLAKLLSKLITNDALAKAIGRKAWETAQTFTLERMCRDIETIYTVFTE